MNTVTLPDLRAWTWYCVSVQSRYDFYSKTSAFTTPHCMQTEGEKLGGVTWEEIAGRSSPGGGHLEEVTWVGSPGRRASGLNV